MIWINGSDTVMRLPPSSGGNPWAELYFVGDWKIRIKGGRRFEWRDLRQLSEQGKHFEWTGVEANAGDRDHKQGGKSVG